MLVKTVEPVGEPGGADLQEGEPELGEAGRHALGHNAGELEHDAGGEDIGVDFAEVLQGAAADLVAVFLFPWMHSATPSSSAAS